MSIGKNHQEHHLTPPLSHRLSHLVASVGFTFGVLVVGLLGTWVVRTVLTESRNAHQFGRVAGTQIDRTTLNEIAAPPIVRTDAYDVQRMLGRSQFLFANTYQW